MTFLHLFSESDKLIITVTHDWSNNLHSKHVAILDETPGLVGCLIHKGQGSGHVATSDRIHSQDSSKHLTYDVPASA